MKPSGSWTAEALALALLAGCAATDPEPNLVFRKFRSAVIDGDFESVYALMSPTFKSHWVFLIYRPQPRTDGKLDLARIAKEFYARLPEELVPEFESWLRTNALYYDERHNVSPLPEPLLQSPWVHDLLKLWFQRAHPMLKHEFTVMEVANRAVPDEGRATVLIKNIRGEQEAYELIFQEHRGWKINYHRVAPSGR